MRPFTFTLDSLLVFARVRVQYVYICIVFVLFAVGFLNNLCSFVTFKRPRPRAFGVGNCLLIVAVLNQCALLCLLVKFVHIFLGSTSVWTSDASCKTISYLLAVCTRSTYWLTSWITIARLLIVIYPAVKTMTDPRVAIRSSIAIVFSLLAMHIHEILFSKSIREPDSLVSLCVIDFGHRSFVNNYHRMSALLHHLIPFFIQVISITLLIILAARQRAKTVKAKITFSQVLRKQLATQRELYVTPAIIVLSGLPEAILSFSLNCTQLNDWQRHSLLAAYLLSYGPQVLGFLLHVIPSTAYKKEFSQTVLAKAFSNGLFKSTTRDDT